MADPSTAARGADPVERWLLGEEARRAALPAVFDALCARLAAAGVPLWRASLN